MSLLWLQLFMRGFGGTSKPNPPDYDWIDILIVSLFFIVFVAALLTVAVAG